MLNAEDGLAEINRTDSSIVGDELRRMSALLHCRRSMSRREIAPAVQAFLAAHLSNLEQFQLLLHVMQTEDRWWDSQTASRELGIPETDARAALDHLAKHNLLDIRITGNVRYRFQPGTAELDAAPAPACGNPRRGSTDR